MFEFFGRWRGGKKSQRNRGAAARRPPARPRLEVLEDRTAPALLTIAQENALAGAPQSQWDINGSGDSFFIVRNDASHSQILFQTSDATWEAYNTYGGNSLYSGTAPSSDGRAYKVSYNRPFSDRGTGGGNGSYNWVFHSEYPMVRWL